MRSAVCMHYIEWMERAPKDTSLTVRLTSEARQMLNELAAADDRSVSSWLERTIRQHHAELRKRKSRD